MSILRFLRVSEFRQRMISAIRPIERPFGAGVVCLVFMPRDAASSSGGRLRRSACFARRLLRLCTRHRSRVRCARSASILIDSSVNCHLPSTKMAPAGGLPRGLFSPSYFFIAFIAFVIVAACTGLPAQPFDISRRRQAASPDARASKGALALIWSKELDIGRLQVETARVAVRRPPFAD